MENSDQSKGGCGCLPGLLIAIYVIGMFFWQDPAWPLTILFNFLGDLGIGHGTTAGYPWEGGSMGPFPHSRYQ